MDLSQNVRGFSNALFPRVLNRNVSTDFRNKFLAVNQSYSPNPDREVYRG